ncbi:MAG TPA: ThuA domain-containing protein [Candidatus Limnocylindria bacterium]|jgi:hypothetical protein|nr:ThuA domain-containing protein [Candidatus Limnocylindria bacterium]
MATWNTVLAKALVLVAGLPGSLPLLAGEPAAPFRVVAFYTGTSDLAHVSFIREAKEWFPKMAAENHFTFESTTNWSQLNPEFLKTCQVVVFWDTRPEAPAQRQAFQEYMERGGAWMGFHFAGFALTPSDFPQNWDWYHRTFLGVGEYVSNTWRPVSTVLRVEVADHPATRGLPATFKSAPSEWYRWQNNLRTNADFKVLLSVDPSSFPLGTGPKPHEIWHSGDYPIVWTNQKYRMIYFNFGHNDMDYEHKTNRQLSSSFSSEDQNRLVLNSLLWLGRGGPKAP